MTIYIFSIIAVLILGILVGSFLNTVIFRSPKKNSSVRGRSYCPKCKEQLKAKDLIPIFSWILLRGKCRYCQQKISTQYLLIELVTGLIFVGSFIYVIQDTAFPTLADPTFLKLVLLWVISSFLIVIFSVDLRTGLILNRTLIYLTPFVLAWAVVNNGAEGLLSSLIGMLVAGILFWILVIVSGEKWMGAGDAKFALLIGFLVGWPIVMVLLALAFIGGAIIGLIMMSSGKANRKTALPFGTFLAAATWIAIIYGDKIANYFF
ncbi:prepilin peptidase [Patescibacteria group bacterium]